MDALVISPAMTGGALIKLDKGNIESSWKKSKRPMPKLRRLSIEYSS